MTTWVVAIGDAFEGIQLAGPFDKASEAAEWAKEYIEPSVSKWRLVSLAKPRYRTNEKAVQ